MSHTSEIDLSIKDLDSLEAAASAIGLELVRGQTSFKAYFANQGEGKCEHVLRIPGNRQAYEIGVAKREDGQPGYKLLTDFWDGGKGMEAVVGKEGDKLKEQYSNQVAVRYWRKKGYRVETSRMEDGRLVVKARK